MELKTYFTFNRLVTILALALCLITVSAKADSLEPSKLEGQLSAFDNLLSRWLARPNLQNSLVGLEVMALPSGRILFSHNGSKRFVPASTLKILTTACAFNTLGQDFRYVTQLLSSGTIKKDKLLGDLLIAPSQDPTLTTQDITGLLLSLKAKKIKRIEGTIRMHAPLSTAEYFDPGWLVEDWGQDWMPVPSSLVLDHNLAPLKDPARGIAATTRTIGKTNSALLSTLLVSNNSPGWVCLDSGNKFISVCRNLEPTMSTNGSLIIANPDDYNLMLVITTARSLGLAFASYMPAHTPDSQPIILGEHQSKQLLDIIRITLKESDNLYAQQLLRTLGLKARATNNHSRARPLEARGIDYLLAWLNGIGVGSNEIILYDGCGLSRKNCLTPHALNMVLRHMAGPDLNGTYLNLLPCQSYADSSQSRFFFKTGAMDSVRSVSGILKTADNKAVAISILVNGHTPSVANLRSEIASLVNELESLALSGSHLSSLAYPTPSSIQLKHHRVVTKQKSPIKTVRRRSQRIRHSVP
ncbi:MAG: D-alanyl-D-alanine carboxypeptidase/D-alanyl-D-alanine-endopeptidase [Candidatus Melainabacteria bacterium]|nr:D-alanyl-D-alanine carboxypeptidase/D-alanyl-D-alanine-endopeptidase [Candidatus Melainabacteria bacterium]